MARCPKCGGEIHYLVVNYPEKGISDILEVGSPLPRRLLLFAREYRCPECDEVLTEDYDEACRILGSATGNFA